MPNTAKLGITRKVILPVMLMVLTPIASFAAAATSLAAAAPPAGPEATSPESLLQAGRVDDAMATLGKRLAVSGNDAEAHHLLSRAFFELGKWDAAIKESERAVSLAPSNSSYHLWLGRAYGRKAEEVNPISAARLAGKMRTQFEKAVELNGDDVGARTDLAEFYLEAPMIVGGGNDKARKQAEDIARHDAATAHWIHARLAEKEKDFDAAEREYKTAIEQSGNRADNWLSLASFYRRRARLDEMEAAVQKAVNAEKRPSNIFFDAATLLYRAGYKLPQAAQFLGRYLSAKDKVEDAPAFRAHFLLGQILEKQGDKAAARKEYQAALALAKDYPDAREALRKLQ